MGDCEDSFFFSKVGQNSLTKHSFQTTEHRSFQNLNLWDFRARRQSTLWILRRNLLDGIWSAPEPFKTGAATLGAEPVAPEKRRVELSGCRAGTYRLVAPAYRLVAPPLTPSVFWSPGSSRHLPGSSRRPKTVQKTSNCLKSSLWCLGAVAIRFFDFTNDLLFPYFILMTFSTAIFKKRKPYGYFEHNAAFVRTVATHYMIPTVFASNSFF